jgi:hypothetical protein
MIRRALSMTFLLSLVVPALAQTPHPISVECFTDGKSLSVTKTNPNPAEALCEYTCSYTAGDNQQHKTSKASIVMLPGTNTSDWGRIDGEPPYSNVSIEGTCDSWTCESSNGKLTCR